MHRNFFFIVSSLCLLVLSSCTEPIEFTGDETDPIPVMQATAEQDSLFTAHLTWSRFFLQDGYTFPTINNANVQLQVNGVAKPLLNSNGGKYNFSYLPKFGDTLLLTAQIPNYERGKLSAQTVVPYEPQVVLESWSVDSSQSSLYNRDYAVSIKIRLNDPGEKDNYYAIKLLYSKKSTDSNDNNNLYTSKFRVNDPLIAGTTSSINIILNEGDNEQSFQELYFSDQKINGKSHTITLKADFHSYTTTSTTDTDSTITYWNDTPDVLQLEVSSLSPEEFRYLQSSTAARENDNNFFGEPVQVICNVKNGVGHLGAIVRKKIRMQFD